MSANVGGADRIIRIVLGIILAAAGFFVMSGTLGIVVGVIGLVLLVTGAIGWCPLYIPLKISTRKS
ncbi:MAG: DUF2892 domain-containing protein [Chloroflexi bacterium]|nr:MAG: DUF2892 domain-containing protein [Chloroflexota bacterium]